MNQANCKLNLNMRKLFAAITFMCYIGLTVTESSVTVDTDLGRIIGYVETVTINGNDVTVNKFLGIPYAKPPTGERRFSKPESVGKLDGDHEATEFSAACLQPPTDAFREFTKMSEDCLYLNIYVPNEMPDRETGHAVMVFIHGGGFQHGAGETYPGDSLASTGNVIVVTFNYRLNLFGFLSTGDKLFPGNFGLWDQHMALQWINKHIKAFGGDNSRVTVFGESAGASSVIYQGLFPQNKGLLTRILSQSGCPGLRLTLNPMPKEQFLFLAQVFGCLNESPLETISCMKQKDAQSIMMALRGIAMDAAKLQKPDLTKTLALVFFPTLDGEFFKLPPADLYLNSKTDVLESVEFFRTLDAMIGHNSQEGSLMLYKSAFYPVQDIDTFMPSRDDLMGGMINAVMAHDFGLTPIDDLIKSMYVSEFTDWTDPFNPERIRETYLELMGNIAFDKATIEFIRIHANSSSPSGSSYAYIFDAVPSKRLLATPKWSTGANHADELGFVFGFMDKLIEDFRQKPSPPLEWEWNLSKQIQMKWSNFAKTGNPNTPVQSGPTWPKYDMTQQQCFKLTSNMTASDSATIPFCNARRANFLLETIPEVMSSLNKRKEESFYLRDSETCDAEGQCNNT